MNQTSHASAKQRKTRSPKINPILGGSVFDNCKGCLYEKDCVKFETCEYLQPKTYGNNLHDTGINNMSLTPPLNSKSKNKKKMPYGMKDTSDGITTLHRHHAHIVNDALTTIRAGKLAYVYTQLALNDIKAYEPNVCSEYFDGIFYIRLSITTNYNLRGI